MMKRWWHYLVLGIVAWLLFLLWRLPAAVVYEMVLPDTPMPVQLTAVRGTLWEGRAQLQQGQNALANLSWDLSAAWLLAGRVAATLKVNPAEGYIDADVVVPVSGGEIAITDLRGMLPMAAVQQHIKAIPLPLEGELTLKLDELLISAEGRPIAAEGRVVWHKAGLQMGESLALGDLQLTLTTVEKGIEGTIRDSGGPLQINATLHLDENASYQLQGTITPSGSTPESLRSMLSMLGQPDSQGGYPLNLSGRI
ncbi:MAG: type II secretion system protein N [Chromatiales bacterium]|nr:type II secretion system protein N [Chromatiales bacterium]